MKFYSGFSLKNESYLFDAYIKSSEYCVCGFSYGAIAALEEVLKMLQEKRRVDTLQLFAPAFFQTKEQKFKRLQLMGYKKNRALYIEQFLQVCFSPYREKIVEQKESSYEELEELLEYVWEEELLQYIANQGVKIEVYLGGLDGVIDSNAAREFFIKMATVTYIKDANHFLQIN